MMQRLKKQQGFGLVSVMIALAILTIVVVQGFKYLHHEELISQAKALGNKISIISNALERRLADDKITSSRAYTLNDLINKDCGGNATKSYLPCGFSLKNEINDGNLIITATYDSINNQTKAQINTDTIGEYSPKYKKYLANSSLSGVAYEEAQASQSFVGYENLAADVSYSFDISTAILQANLISENVVSDNVGQIVAYVGNTPPNGYFECNGAVFDQTKYPELYKVLGSNKLPDLRGQFVRGWDHGKGVDQGRVLGSLQGDAIRNISGSFTSSNGAVGAFGSSDLGPFSPGGGSTGKTYINGQPSSASYTSMGFNAARVVPTANEDRPKNVAEMYIIKHD